jgi:hypothetical protein
MNTLQKLSIWVRSAGRIALPPYSGHFLRREDWPRTVAA